MKLLAIVATLTFWATAYPQKLTLIDFESREQADWESKGLLLYDTNLRDRDVALNGSIKGMVPHSGEVGVAMYGGLPGLNDDYTLGPRGPLVVSFVQPQTGRPAAVRQVSFWVSNPWPDRRYPPPLASFDFFDSDGQLVGHVQSTTNLFPVSARGEIASVWINSTDYMMADDFEFDRPRIVRDALAPIFNAKQFRGATNLIDFEQFPDGTVPAAFTAISNQWQQSGVLISDGSSNAAVISRATMFVPSKSGTNGVAANGTLVLAFVDPQTGQPRVVSEAGVWISNGNEPSTVTFLDRAGRVLETVTTSGKYFFAGTFSKRGIARISISDSDSFLADDLQFSRVR